MDDLLSEFLVETGESLSGLDEALLVLEKTPGDAPTVGLIFRLVHTIKGTCGFLGLPRLERVAHAAENVLGMLRDGSLTSTPALITAVLQAVDAMKSIVANLASTGKEPDGDDSAVIALLDAQREPPCAASQPPALAKAPRQRRPAARKRAAPSDAEQPASATPQAAPPPPPVATATPPAAAVPEPAAAQQTIRVNVGVLENLMTLVSELVLTRNQLLQISRSAEDTAFNVPVQRLSQITSDLQESVMKTRMQPINSAWSKLPRLIRDLSQELGKSITLAMLGAETEIDRQVLELVRDPLTHMVRNSADHGLESPEARRAAGKREQGTITLNAYHEGGNIIVEVADDGRGLPLDRIRQKILANNLATETELAGLSDAAVQEFIFHPGFSTAAQVTSVSGRGVGMDVVKTNVEKIGGSVQVHSREGVGTTFIIKIPLTLAIVSALIVESSGERFAIAQNSVAELVHATPATDRTPPGGDQIVIESIDNVSVLRLRERLLPLVVLSDLLKLGGDTARPPQASVNVVVVTVGRGSFGIVVDRVFDTEEIVVKPVAPVLRDLTIFSGNTVLGDGSVIMILDPTGVARAIDIAPSDVAMAPASAAAAGTRSEDKIEILVVRSGSDAPKAVPLELVARLERIPAERIERSADRFVTQYCGKLMPLVALGRAIDVTSRPEHPVLVFRDGEHSVGLLVDEIVDVVHDRLLIEMNAAEPGLLGTAVIAGAATEVVDTVYWLSQAGEDWFKTGRTGDKRARLLVIEDSAFFRNMLIPALSSAGYHVTAVNSAEEALSLQCAGAAFEAIISDIEMPGMDGLEFVRQARKDGGWQGLPIIALSGRATPIDIEVGLRAGFSHYLQKFDREALLDRLERCLHPDLQVAA